MSHDSYFQFTDDDKINTNILTVIKRGIDPYNTSCPTNITINFLDDLQLQKYEVIDITCVHFRTAQGYVPRLANSYDWPFDHGQHLVTHTGYFRR